MPFNSTYMGHQPPKYAKEPTKPPKNPDQMAYNVKKAPEIVDQPGSDASDFLPGVCYDGWSAQRALVEYMAGEIDVWDYEEILDCLIEEWQNPTNSNVQQKKSVQDYDVWDQSLLKTYQVPPRIVSSASCVDYPSPELPPTPCEVHSLLSPFEDAYPFKVIQNPFGERNRIEIEYKGVIIGMTKRGFVELSKSPKFLMEHLEKAAKSLSPDHDSRTWQWNGDTARWELIEVLPVQTKTRYGITNTL